MFGPLREKRVRVESGLERRAARIDWLFIALVLASAVVGILVGFVHRGFFK